jgi:hypothetical protein
MKSQAKEGPKGGRMVAEQGARGGRSTGSEGIRGGKDHESTVRLGEGLEVGSVHSAHKKGLVNGLGAKQAASVAPGGESDHETLRHGKKPQPEKVTYLAPLNKAVQKKAHGFNERSQNGGAEKEGGW